MASPGGFKPSHLPPIAETGLKGFLKWYQREQPAIYQKLAVQLQAQAPQAFSDYTQSMTQALRARAGVASLQRRLATRGRTGSFLPGSSALHGLGDDFTDMLEASPDPQVVSTFQPVTVDSIALPAGYNPPPVDTSEAANTGAGTSTNTTNLIASIIGGVTGAYTSVMQANTAAAITDVQLQRARAGLSPLNIGMNANGIPTIGGSAFAGGSATLLLIGGAVLLFMLLGRGGSRAAA